MNELLYRSTEPTNPAILREWLSENFAKVSHKSRQQVIPPHNLPLRLDDSTNSSSTVGNDLIHGLRSNLIPVIVRQLNELLSILPSSPAEQASAEKSDLKKGFKILSELDKCLDQLKVTVPLIRESAESDDILEGNIQKLTSRRCFLLETKVSKMFRDLADVLHLYSRFFHDYDSTKDDSLVETRKIQQLQIKRKASINSYTTQEVIFLNELIDWLSRPEVSIFRDDWRVIADSIEGSIFLVTLYINRLNVNPGTQLQTRRQVESLLRLLKLIRILFKKLAHPPKETQPCLTTQLSCGQLDLLGQLTNHIPETVLVTYHKLQEPLLGAALLSHVLHDLSVTFDKIIEVFATNFDFLDSTKTADQGEIQQSRSWCQHWHRNFTIAIKNLSDLCQNLIDNEASDKPFR